MAFIPVYYPTSFLASYALAQDYGVKQLGELATSQNNYDIGVDATQINGQVYGTFRINCTSASNITGIVAPTNTSKIIILQNVGTATATLKNASGSSSAANRMNATSGADVSLTAGSSVILIYDSAATAWTIGTEIASNSFKLAIPGNTEGLITLLPPWFYSAKNTGLDTSGSTVSGVVIYYRYGVTAPTASYAANTAATRESVPITASVDEIIQTKRSNPGIYWLCSSSTATVLEVRINEQGRGMSRH